MVDEDDQRASPLAGDGAHDHRPAWSADLFGGAPGGGMVGTPQGVRDVSRAAGVYPGFAQGGYGRTIARPLLLRDATLEVLPAHLRTAAG